MRQLIFFIFALSVVFSCPEIMEAENISQYGDANMTCIEDCCGTLPSRLPMTYRYYQNTGKFIGGSGDYFINTTGYSGAGEGKMNPDHQCVTNGPLPAAKYRLAYWQKCYAYYNYTTLFVYLAPQQDTKMCGRGDFFVHGCGCCTEGDSTIPPVDGCSAGCVVINHENRRKLRIGDTLIVYNYETDLLSQQ